MKKLFKTLLFTPLLCFYLNPTFAQQKPIKYLEDKSSAYISILNTNALGRYRNLLNQTQTQTSNIGIAVGYLLNPYKGKRPSPVFYGLEFGYHSGGTDGVVAKVDGDFASKYNNYWLNGVVRYRPLLGSTRLNPYFDGFFGGKLISTNIIEYLSNEETQSLDSFNKLVPNYGLGIGTGIKLTGSLKNAYLDIGLYYQQTDPTKIVKRNSVVINQNFTVDYQKITSNSNQFIIKIGLTGFFAH